MIRSVVGGGDPLQNKHSNRWWNTLKVRWKQEEEEDPADQELQEKQGCTESKRAGRAAPNWGWREVKR